MPLPEPSLHTLPLPAHAAPFSQQTVNRTCVINLSETLYTKHHCRRRMTSAGPCPSEICSRRQSRPRREQGAANASARHSRSFHCTCSGSSSSSSAVLKIICLPKSSGNSTLGLSWILTLAAPVLSTHAARQAATPSETSSACLAARAASPQNPCCARRTSFSVPEVSRPCRHGRRACRYRMRGAWRRSVSHSATEQAKTGME